jgi:peptidoglycan/LPS O-acetylase OafA/YrhL
MQRPSWLPKYLPELDGMRGVAILAVILYHCNPRLKGTWLYGPSLWGWAGVIVFFVLSGFLITSILLTTSDQPHYFHNFHARRALRIWPVYLLVLIVVYLNAPWFIGPPVWQAIKTAPWWAYLLFIQNLFPLQLPPALGPTWALAIEEQYYFVWAPLVRWALWSLPPRSGLGITRGSRQRIRSFIWMGWHGEACWRWGCTR